MLSIMPNLPTSIPFAPVIRALGYKQ